MYERLKKLGLLDSKNTLLDLGCGNGQKSLPYYKNGFNVTLVDKNKEILKIAKQTFEQNRRATSEFKIIEEDIKDFVSKDKFDVILLLNVLPFLSSEDEIKSIILENIGRLKNNGLMVINIFGSEDEWAKNRKEMTFVDKQEFLSFFPKKPIYVNEERGLTPLISGDTKDGHIISAIYEK